MPVRHRLLNLVRLACLMGMLATPALAQRAPQTQPAGRPAAVFVAAPASIEELKAIEQQVKKVIEKVRPTVVGVAGGSGVVVSEDGLVMSVAHVGGRSGRQISFSFANGKTARGTTLGNDREADAGMMKITDKGPWPFAPIGKSADVKPGQWCIAMGNPVSFGRSRGPIVRIGRVLFNGPMGIITDCTIMGGDSGGPLFDLEGNVIGIHSTCGDSVLQNVHVPAGRFQQYWDGLVKGEDVTDGRFGRTAFLGVGPDQEAGGARVGSVVPDSAAAKAGVQVGDIIVRFAGRELRDFVELPILVRQRKPGDRIEVQVRRGDEVLKLPVTLGELSQ